MTDTDTKPKRAPRKKLTKPRAKPGTVKNRALLTLEQQALDRGYQPGQFQIERILEGIELVKRWDEYLRYDMYPPEFSSVSATKRARARMAASVAEAELALMPYIHPKKKQVEANTKIEGELTLVDLLQRAGR